MRIINPSFKIETEINGKEILLNIEKIARLCHKSEDKIKDFENTKKFVRNVIKSGHESVIEHINVTVRFITSRGITHEIVRHRLASFTQISTRYANYSDEKFGREISVIAPFLNNFKKESYDIWFAQCLSAEKTYMEMLDNGCTPQIARSVLPNCLSAEIIMTANLREWRHLLKLRTAPDAHPEMIDLMTPLLKELKEKIPVIFDEI